MEFQPGIVFEPGDILIMQEGLQRACRALAFGFQSGQVDTETRLFLAGEIISHASRGVRSPRSLADHALRRLPPIEAAYLRHAQAA